ncbi:apyrase [Coccinella septempunctata]|uniref:apyrase n=1 Tax=Coccinella septempunctata TaxID=41139 RepID=UPI001D067BE0|nr:apyrase [Coccinella septempunctata]
MENRILIHDLEEMSSPRDWRKALKKPPAYRIINRTFGFRNKQYFYKMMSYIGIASLVCLLVVYYIPSWTGLSGSSNFNNTYPITAPVKANDVYTYRIGIIADLDTDSKHEKEKNTWYSLFKKGFLSYDAKTQNIVVSWDSTGPITLKNSYALKGRGMELSELVVYDGRLLTFDDRTGIVYEIVGDNIIPWVLLMDGNGKNAKGFKTEWAAVKNEKLYLGSMGKEWTTATGEFQNYNPMWIKVVHKNGAVKHVNWVDQYKNLRKVLGIEWPGYMIHESGLWSEIHQKWFFLPRRCSKEPYDEVADERRGCSVLISADDSVSTVRIVKIPNEYITRGFSSFKFLPNTNDEVIVALRTEELEGKTRTFFTSFTIRGQVLVDDLFIADTKYEGLEFI